MIKKKTAFTLVEIMVSVVIAVIAIGIIITAFLMGDKLWRAGTKQAALQREAQILSEKISRGMRPARSISIKDSGNTLEFVTDPNATPLYYADDRTSSFSIAAAGTTTPEGETIYRLVYDPDISQAGDEGTWSSSLVKDAASALFQRSGRQILVNFSLKDDFAGDGFQSLDVSTSIYFRN